MHFLRLTDFSAAQLRRICALAQAPVCRLSGGTVGWSFEGNGIRTRTTFLAAFRELGMDFTELPNLLKTNERPQDIAGYLDPYFVAYVIRESDHARLEAFAQASTRPVINAMSAAGHPCEVLADFCTIESMLGPIEQMTIGLWGAPTNVFRSWYELAQVLGIEIIHFCDALFHVSVFHDNIPHVRFVSNTDSATVDYLITDGWPRAYMDAAWTLTEAHLARMGGPRLLPTPPFTIGQELGFDPATYAGFVGYEQKRALLPVQRAILTFVLEVI